MLTNGKICSLEETNDDKEEGAFPCVICKRKITRTQFKLIIRKALSRKHNLSLRLFSLQIMNQIINQVPSKVCVDYIEKTHFEIVEEHFKRFYSNKGYKFKQAVVVSSKTQKPRPKIYIPKYRKIVQKWVYMQESLIKKRQELKSRYNR